MMFILGYCICALATALDGTIAVDTLRTRGEEVDTNIAVTAIVLGSILWPIAWWMKAIFLVKGLVHGKG